MHIENILIPNLEKLRKRPAVYVGFGQQPGTQQAKADRDNRIYYLSTVKADDDDFGKPNKYKIIMPAAYEENEVYDPFCKKPVRNGTPDSIAAYNNSIKEWVRVLKQNEDEKLAAVKAGDSLTVIVRSTPPHR